MIVSDSEKECISGEITLEANLNCTFMATDFIGTLLERLPCPLSIVYKINIVIEELFSNVANYAYPDSTGMVTISCVINKVNKQIRLDFIDEGIPFNPLTVTAPNLASKASLRNPGGLGIHIIRKFSEKVLYEYKDGQNRVTVYKKYA